MAVTDSSSAIKAPQPSGTAATRPADRGDIGGWQLDDTQWIDILPWTHSDVIHADRAPNTLAITTHGPSLLFQVNGATLATLNYDKLPNSGNLGIFVGGDLNEVTVDRLQITNTD